MDTPLVCCGVKSWRLFCQEREIWSSSWICQSYKNGFEFFFIRNCLFQKTHFLDKIVSNDYKNIFRLRGKKTIFRILFWVIFVFLFLSTASHLCSVREIRLWGWPTKKLILSWSFLSPKLFKNFSRFKIQHVFA